MEMGPVCSSYKLPRSTKKSRAVPSLDHPEQAMLHTLVCSYGPGQERITGQHPRVTWEQVGIAVGRVLVPCVSLTVLGFNVDFVVHFIGFAQTCDINSFA